MKALAIISAFAIIFTMAVSTANSQPSLSLPSGLDRVNPGIPDNVRDRIENRQTTTNTITTAQFKTLESYPIYRHSLSEIQNANDILCPMWEIGNDGKPVNGAEALTIPENTVFVITSITISPLVPEMNKSARVWIHLAPFGGDIFHCVTVFDRAAHFTFPTGLVVASGYLIDPRLHGNEIDNDDSIHVIVNGYLVPQSQTRTR